jgi:hypothetical protein
MVQPGNLESKQSEGVYEGQQTPLMGVQGEQTRATLEVPRNAEEEKEAPKKQVATYRRVNSTLEDTATEQRNLGTLAHKIKCKWQERRTEVGGEQEVDCA